MEAVDLFPTCRVEDDRRDPTESGGRVLRGRVFAGAGRPECPPITQTEQMVASGPPRAIARNPPLNKI